MTAVDACDIGRHGLVGTATLKLIEGALALLALLALVGVGRLHVVLLVFVELLALEDVFPFQWKGLMCRHRRHLFEVVLVLEDKRQQVWVVQRVDIVVELVDLCHVYVVEILGAHVFDPDVFVGILEKGNLERLGDVDREVFFEDAQPRLANIITISLHC